MSAFSVLYGQNLGKVGTFRELWLVFSDVRYGAAVFSLRLEEHAASAKCQDHASEKSAMLTFRNRSANSGSPDL